MPQPIKMKIKLHVIICLVSAVGRATVTVMCFTRTCRSSTTSKTRFFYLRTVNCPEKQVWPGFFSYTYMTMRSNILLHCDQKYKKIE
jgi:hypothetical protein